MIDDMFVHISFGERMLDGSREVEEVELTLTISSVKADTFFRKVNTKLVYINNTLVYNNMPNVNNSLKMINITIQRCLEMLMISQQNS